MSSLQQPAQKRSRSDSNVSAHNNNCNTPTNINLLSLPDEALNNIISYSMPRIESQVWQWIGILSQTCRSLRQHAQSCAPTRIVLTDFRYYSRLNSGGHRSVDVRVEFLRSLCDCSWKRQHLKEFHVNPKSVLRKQENEESSYEECNDIKTLLHTLITTPSSFPELEWLDIEVQSNKISNEYHLVDAESLQVIPDALPALIKLCLSGCFKSGTREISPHQLRQFFTNFQTPLNSLSLCGPEWMSDVHVKAIMPIIGERLMRLELVDCSTALNNESRLWNKRLLSDISIMSIGQHCKQLKSFSMVNSDITSRGLEMVLRANTSITALNLSLNRRLDTGAVDIISRYLPRLEVLRNYWSPNQDDWLNDDGLIALVDSQERESGGSRIFLNLIGLLNLCDDEPQLTIRGMKYAIEKGLREIEIAGGELHNLIKDMESDVQLYQANYPHYIDGSKYEREEKISIIV